MILVPGSLPLESAATGKGGHNLRKCIAAWSLLGQPGVYFNPCGVHWLQGEGTAIAPSDSKAKKYLFHTKELVY